MKVHDGATGAEATMSIFDGVVYSDLFDCALRLDEVVRYSGRAVGPEEVVAALASSSLGGAVVRKDGYFTVSGREGLVEQRVETQSRALRLQRRAQRVNRVLRLVPFVRGLILTGSVAAEAAAEDADIDLLVIVSPGRLAFVFLVLGGFSRLTRRRVFCANFYLSEDRLRVERHNLFVAREIAQARPLDEDAERFFEINDWIRDFLPNASPSRALGGRRPGARWMQRLLEWPFKGRFGRWCESFAGRVARRRIDAHYRAAPEDQRTMVSDRFAAGHELRFHNHPDLRGLRARYEAHRASLRTSLDATTGQMESER